MSHHSKKNTVVRNPTSSHNNDKKNNKAGECSSCTETNFDHEYQHHPLRRWSPKAPDWVRYGRQHALELWGEPLVLPEWMSTTTTRKYRSNDGSNSNPDRNNDHDNNNNNRSKEGMGASFRNHGGWNGRDLLHDTNAPVRVLEYYIRYNNNNSPGKDDGIGIGKPTILTGIVHFTAKSESHRGFCHGGGFCAVMDDVMAWCAFCATGQCRPWSGYSAQINTRLLRPIPLGSILLVQASIVRIEGSRKVYVQAKLSAPTVASIVRAVHGQQRQGRQNDPSLNNNTERLSVVAGGSGENQKNDSKDKEDEIVHALGDGLIILNNGILPPPTKTEENNNPVQLRSRL